MDTSAEAPEDRFFLVEHKSTETAWVKNSSKIKTPNDVLKEACKHLDLDYNEYKLAWYGALLMNKSPLPLALKSYDNGGPLQKTVQHTTLDLIEKAGLDEPVFVRLIDPNGITHCSAFKRTDCLLNIVKRLFHELSDLPNPQRILLLYKDNTFTYEDCNHLKLIDLSLQEDPWFQIRLIEESDEAICCKNEEDKVNEYSESPWMDINTKNSIQKYLNEIRKSSEWWTCYLPPKKEYLIQPYYGVIYKEKAVEKHLETEYDDTPEPPNIYRIFSELISTDCHTMTTCPEAVVLRIAFPSPFVLQGIFARSQTIEHVKNFIRSCLAKKKLVFDLYEKSNLSSPLDAKLCLEALEHGQGFLFFATEKTRSQPWFHEEFLQPKLLEGAVSRGMAASAAAAYAPNAVWEICPAQTKQCNMAVQNNT